MLTIVTILASQWRKRSPRRVALHLLNKPLFCVNHTKQMQAIIVTRCWYSLEAEWGAGTRAGSSLGVNGRSTGRPPARGNSILPNVKMRPVWITYQIRIITA